MADYKFDPDMEECIIEVLKQAKESYRLAHMYGVMLTPITVKDLLAEASRLRVVKMDGESLKRLSQLDKEREEEVPSGYPSTLQ